MPRVSAASNARYFATASALALLVGASPASGQPKPIFEQDIAAASHVFSVVIEKVVAAPADDERGVCRLIGRVVHVERGAEAVGRRLRLEVFCAGPDADRPAGPSFVPLERLQVGQRFAGAFNWRWSRFGYAMVMWSFRPLPAR